ncbi:caspase family protein [Bradyrhizobium sp. WSM 1704]|uniref:caspase family protein n=1 Tax=Bradyrhizobium semiaridum TaxID=2821404 RepID=UPI001CE2CD20|nr:caspase family protein [Bradyrhizobium semiaridum]MCA6122115.1 caspase family protein [Bradyrhizobium semiaridum]
MSKRALLVGINQYDHVPSLGACIADAKAMDELISFHANRSRNFDTRLLLSPGTKPVTRATLRTAWDDLFAGFKGDVLFYFSGHGAITSTGAYLVTQEGTTGDPGLAMDDLVNLANQSSASTVLLIIDCCFSGSTGNLNPFQNGGMEKALLREGVTILAASRSDEPSMEVDGHGVFTNLVLGALRGGAADVRGRVSAASIYAYAEAALGAWDQRPPYKSHAAHLEPVRLCDPKVDDKTLHGLATYFPTADHEFQLDPTFEETNGKTAKPENVAIFKTLKQYQIAGLVKPKVGTDLYWSAEQSGFVLLTDLGKFYLQLVQMGRL